MSNKSENSVEVEDARGLHFVVRYTEDSKLGTLVAEEQAARAGLERWNETLAARRAELAQTQADIEALSPDVGLDRMITLQQREAALSYIAHRFARPSANLQGAWNKADAMLELLKSQIARKAAAVIDLRDADIRMDASPNFRKSRAAELQASLDETTGVKEGVEVIRVPRVTSPQPATGPEFNEMSAAAQ